MKLTSALTLIAILVGLSSVPAHAKELTLDDCIDLALKNRASIIRARGSESMASAEKRSALGAFLPRVYASYSYSKRKETEIRPLSWTDVAWTVDRLDTIIVVDTSGGPNQQAVLPHFLAVDSVLNPDEQEVGPNKSWSVGTDVSLFNLPNWFNLAAAGAGKARAELDVLASEQDLIYSVKISYYAYLAFVQNLDVQLEAVRRAEEQLKLIESRYELGSASRSDVLKQKVQFGNDRLSLLRASNSVTSAKADLAYTIGLDPREKNDFSSHYEVREYNGSLDDAVDFSMQSNPSLLAQQKTVDQTGHSVRAAMSSYLPTLSASAGWSKFNGTQAYPAAFEYSSQTTSWGFSVNFNIFDGFYREQRVTSAKVYRNNARADLADLRNYTVSRVKTAHSDLGQLKEQKIVSQENVEAAEEDLRITQEKYNLGAAAILDLLDAQVSLKRAQVALIQVDIDLNLAIAKLENAMGKR